MTTLDAPSDKRLIRFRCESCRATLQVGERLMGQRIACPKCGEPNLVPVPSQFNTSDVTAIDSESVRSSRSETETQDLPDPSRSSVDYAAERIRSEQAQSAGTVDPSRADMVAAWPRATARERWTAALFDGAIAATVGATVALGMSLHWDCSTSQSVGAFGLAVLLTGIVNDVLGIRLKNASFGKWLVGIEIRKVVNGESPATKDIWIRLLAKWPLGVLLFPLTLLDPKTRSVHDLISDTRALRAPKP